MMHAASRCMPCAVLFSQGPARPRPRDPSLNSRPRPPRPALAWERGRGGLAESALIAQPRLVAVWSAACRAHPRRSAYAMPSVIRGALTRVWDALSGLSGARRCPRCGAACPCTRACGTPTRGRQRARRAGPLNDLHRFDPAAGAWTDLSGAAALGAVPPPRYSPGLASVGDRLFVFGGQSLSGRRLSLSCGQKPKRARVCVQMRVRAPSNPPHPRC